MPHPAGVVYPFGGVMATDEIPERDPPPFNVVFSCHNYVSIAAPPLTVLTAILDTNSWDKWNNFNRSAKIYFHLEPESFNFAPPELSALFSRPDFLSPGCKYTESVHRNGTDLSLPAPEKGKALNNLEVVSIEEFEGKDGKKSYRLAWKLIDWSPWLIQSRRVHDFVEKGGNTEYDCWTEQSGVLAWVLRWTFAGGTFKTRFQEAFKSLKVYLESGGKGGADVEAREGEGTERG